MIKRAINEDKIDLQNPNIYYIAGLVATDGFIRDNNIILTLSGNSGLNILTKIANYLEYKGEIKRRDNHGGFSINPYYELTLYSVKLIQLFKDYFSIIGRKCDGLDRFPDTLIKCTEDCQRMYIRGVFDGDGCFDTSKGRYQITSGNYKFILSLTNFINTHFNWSIEVKRREDKEERYPYIILPRKNSEELANWIYLTHTNKSDLYIDYKYDKYLNYESMRW